MEYKVKLLTLYVAGYRYIRDTEYRQMSHITASCILPFLLFCILKHTGCIISPLDLRITHYWVAVCQYSFRLEKMALPSFTLYFSTTLLGMLFTVNFFLTFKFHSDDDNGDDENEDDDFIRKYPSFSRAKIIHSRKTDTVGKS